MRLRKGLTATTFAGLALILGAASFAWACSEPMGPYLNPLNPNSGPSGTDVEVSGGQWAVGSVEIRLGVGGPLLAEATVKGGTRGVFSSMVRIHAPAGTLNVAASQDGTTRVMPFEVTGATASTGSQGGSSPDDSTGGSASGATTAYSSGDGSTTGSTGQGSATAGTGGVATRPSGIGGIPEERQAEPVPGQTPAQAAPGAASGSGSRVARLPAGAPGSVTAPAASATERPGGSSAAEVEAAASLRRTVDGAGSGFAVGSTAPGLTDQAQAPAQSSSPPVGALAGLFGVGLAALFGGFATASLRRRRAPSSPND